ncbi:hypothetical protein GCM10009639_02350 [Kitasatospora putterlickiae]|uniref:HTH cro/C1-type domain-containing protein n=1 Tax=Kitasatospora putterlickiae TaxID=221725 RepID=A0ABN1XIT3_9ACTN
MARFAERLQDTRETSGLTLRQLSRRSGFSPATLSTAESGRRLPSWDVTAAFVAGCGETDTGRWRGLWEAAREEAAGAGAPPSAGEAEQADGRTPGPDGPNTDRTADGPPAGTDADPAVTPRRGLLRRTWPMAVVALISSAATALGLLLATPADKSLPAAQDGSDPKPYDCPADATNLDQVPVVLPQETVIDGRVQPSGTVLGTVTLRHSARCGGAWSRFDPDGTVFTQPNQGTVTTRAVRTSDGTYTQFHLGHIDQSYADLLLTGIGCVEAHATVTVANDGVTAEGVTQCLPKLA